MNVSSDLLLLQFKHGSFEDFLKNAMQGIGTIQNLEAIQEYLEQCGNAPEYH